MVAHNPLFHGPWTLQRFNSTIVSDIWPEIIFFSLFATMVTLISEKTDHKLGLNNQLLTVSGVVLGLVISFRTSSAYERFQDGSKMWTNIITASRTLAQQIWIHVPLERESPEVDVRSQGVLEVVIEKKTMINMIHAFAVSVKHLLRGEPGVYYEDLYPLVCFLPRYASPSAARLETLPLWYVHDDVQQTSRTTETLSNTNNEGKQPESRGSAMDEILRLKPSSTPPQSSIYDYIPLVRLFRWFLFSMLRRPQVQQPQRKPKRIAYSLIVESNVPLEIYLVLSNYTAFLMRNGYIQLAVASGMTNSLFSLHDSLSNLERICNNTLPFAYQAHLRMCLFFYLLLLPFQLLNNFGYFTIPATSLVSLLLIGFLEIGQEIENPFNYGLNDLDLDWFCELIRRELLEITAQTNRDPFEFTFDTQNQPFAPFDRRNAKDLSNLLDGEYLGPTQAHAPPAGMDSIRNTLVQNWKQVDTMTRE